MLYRCAVMLTLLLLLAPSGYALAKGQSPDATVIITGGGLSAPLVARGAATRALGMAELMMITCYNPATCGSGKPPAHRGLVYTLIRVGWDHVLYYPARNGQPASIYYIGLLQTGASSVYDGRWFPLSPAGERALRRLLAAHGVRN